jgi:glutamate carboxypeptidase
MDAKTPALNLSLDLDQMLDGLQRWVECESPTFDVEAVNRMMSLAASDLTEMGASVERIAGPTGLGDCLRASFPHPRQGEPGVLIMAHLDTVHPVGTLQKLPFRRDGGRCYGPGILDMKGGTFAALQAIRALADAAIETPLPVYALLTSDEEIGSPGTRPLIEAEAKRHKYILVPEPARENNGVVSGRYAIARFNLTAQGRPSHAGATLKKGRSAIREMAQQILAIEDMTDEDCTFSVGVVHGGRWVNCVSTECRAEALSMAKRQADLDRGITRMLDRNAIHEDGTGFKVELGVVRPVWEPDEGTMALFAQAEKAAASLGLSLSHGSAGGGSDGNFTGALGIPTLDGLGLSGDGYHTLEEHITVDSLLQRTQLMAGLLVELGEGEAER